MTAKTLTQHSDYMQVLTGYPFDAFETGLLTVARHHLDALRCPETQAWHLAYSIAAERWGDSIGLPASHLLARFIKFVVACRTDGFEHNDPFCEQSRSLVTEDEAALMYALHYMRRDDTPAAREAVEALTKGRLDPDVIRSGLTFANRFPAGKSPHVASQAVTKLRLVS